MAIQCCKDCIAPKRYPGCHGKCQEYIQAKAAHDAQNEAKRKKNAISYGITMQRTVGVTKALKSGRRIPYMGKQL